MPHFKVAIVGAGPAGYFAAQALQNLANEEQSFSIDMIERLPTPWGLVRSGVAPDHPKIKTVSKVFEKIANTENFRLFANVEVGTEITVAQLQEKYDAVIIATGSSIGKKLGIPGEELRGSLSAAVFVPWYNAHPDFVGVDTPLDADTAVVIGAGNVAMDVARMLALEPSELDPTDTADHAIDALKKSNGDGATFDATLDLRSLAGGTVLHLDHVLRLATGQLYEVADVSPDEPPWTTPVVGTPVRTVPEGVRARST